LTALQVVHAKALGMYADGSSLYLQVKSRLKVARDFQILIVYCVGCAAASRPKNSVGRYWPK